MTFSSFSVSLAFGIPSIGRATKSYLIETIESMLRGLSEEDKNDVVIIVFLGDVSITEIFTFDYVFNYS